MLSLVQVIAYPKILTDPAPTSATHIYSLLYYFFPNTLNKLLHTLSQCYHFHLLSNSLCLPPPIISIGIKDEHTTIRKGPIKHMCHYQHDYEGYPLKPGGGSCPGVIGREGDEGEEED
jgi:hypothetical protein